MRPGSTGQVTETSRCNTKCARARCSANGQIKVTASSAARVLEIENDPRMKITRLVQIENDMVWPSVRDRRWVPTTGGSKYRYRLASQRASLEAKSWK